MDNDYELNVGEIVQTVESAEVLTLRFVVLSQRLLIDTRFTAVDGPMLKLVPPVKTAEERFRSLKQLRPRFRIPEKICSVWWPKHIDSLATSGVWPAIARRVIDSGSPDAAQLCEDVFRERHSGQGLPIALGMLQSGPAPKAGDVAPRPHSPPVDGRR
jgi:hypothetical protein